MKKNNIFLVCFFMLLPFAAYTELASLDEESMEAVSAQTGISVEVTTNAPINLYYIDNGTNGAGIKIEGLQVVATNPATGALLSTPSAVTTDLDINDRQGESGGELSIATTFAANSAVKIDAIRLGSTNNLSGDAAFTNVYSATNGASPAPSLGRVNLTGMTGTAVVKVRAH